MSGKAGLDLLREMYHIDSVGRLWRDLLGVRRWGDPAGWVVVLVGGLFAKNNCCELVVGTS